MPRLYILCIVLAENPLGWTSPVCLRTQLRCHLFWKASLVAQAFVRDPKPFSIS